jgi:hypothetical protein
LQGSDGNVGIGTGTPTGPLHILADGSLNTTMKFNAGTGRSTGTAVQFDAGYSSGTPIIYAFNVADSGLSGNAHVFGVYSNSNPLFVIKSTGIANIQSEINNTGSSLTSGLNLINTYNTVGRYSSLIFSHGSSGTPTSAIQGVSTDIGSGYGDITFYTRSAGGWTEKMRVNSLGNVGIGSTSPGYNLDLVGEFNLTDAIRVAGDAGVSGYLLTSSGGGANTWTDPATLGGSGTNWWDNTDNVYHPIDEYASVVDLAIGGTSTASADIQLFANGAAVFNEQSNNVNFRIESDTNANAFFLQGSDGNVGIGTNTPTLGKLQVVGGIYSNLAGSVSAPNFMTNDNNSGLYGGAGGTLGLTVNGSSRLLINSTSSLVIQSRPGTTNDTVVALKKDNTWSNGENLALGWLTVGDVEISQIASEFVSGSGYRMDFKTYASTLDTQMSIDWNGNVGIGTTTPVGKLNVSGATTGKALVLLQELGDQDILTASNSAGTTRFRMANTGYMYAERFADISNNNYFLDPAGGTTSMAVVSNVGIGTTTPGAKLEVRNSSTEDILKLFDNTVEVLTVIDGGNVGIGTTTPGSKLDIAGNLRIRGDSTDATFTGAGGLALKNSTDNSFLSFHGNTGSTLAYIQGTSSNLEIAKSTSGDIRFWTGGSVKVTIDSSGNVGIGTTTPGANLSFDSAATKTIQVDPRTTAAAGSNLIVSAGNSGAGTDLAGGELRLSAGATTGSGTSFLSFYVPALGFTGTTVRPPVEVARVTHSGLAINTTTLARSLTVSGTARISTSYAVTDTLTLCTDANGDIEFKSGACSTSSIRYKENVNELSYGLDEIRQMNPVFFEYKNWVNEDLSSRTKRKVGFIAEDMEKIIPEVVIYEDGLVDGIDYAFLTSVLAKGIQELDAKVTSIFENLVANSATIANLTVDSLKVGTQTLEEYIIGVINQQNSNPNNQLLSPIVEDLTATGSSKLSSLLVENNATVAGTLTTENLIITNEATVSGSLLANILETQTLLVTQDATIEGTLTAQQIDATSARIAMLEAGMAQLDSVRATTAELMTATVSGTLYANNIYDFESKVATTLQQPGLLDVLLGTSEDPTASYVDDLYATINSTQYSATSSADLNLTLADLSMTSDDVVITGTALFIEKYFKVNGSGYISDSLAVGNTLFVGESMQIADGLIRFNSADPANQILKIQPEGQGSIELLAGIVTIDDSGTVTVNGDLDVKGKVKIDDTLLANLLTPTDFGNPLQVQVAGVDTQTNEVKKSRFEIINEVGTPVATFSAEGRAEFAGGIGVASQDLGSNDSNEFSTDKTSGKATIKAGATEVVIRSGNIKENSLVYVTAVGSTRNQVLYVKSQATDDPNTPDQEGRFVVGFDNPTTTDIAFNWWIVN